MLLEFIYWAIELYIFLSLFFYQTKCIKRESVFDGCFKRGTFEQNIIKKSEGKGIFELARAVLLRLIEKNNKKCIMVRQDKSFSLSKASHGFYSNHDAQHNPKNFHFFSSVLFTVFVEALFSGEIRRIFLISYLIYYYQKSAFFFGQKAQLPA